MSALSRGGRCLFATVTASIGAALIAFWLYRVNSAVPDPYLDEVFHVRQAQVYWAHRWREWDPKITTPPGLYLCSFALAAALYLISRQPADLSAGYLRSFNALVLFNLLQARLRSLWTAIRKPVGGSASKGDERTSQSEAWVKSLTALNICLFPPVFFFSGLYYTDLAALLIVLEAYAHDLSRNRGQKERQTPGSGVRLMGEISWRDLAFLGCGLLALVFRQTNIFWVAVFLGGLRVVQTIHTRATECQSSKMQRIVWSSWQLRQLYDPPVSQASFEDYLKVAISLGIAALANLGAIITTLVPYLSILCAFGLFVLWNGGVVLGHKEFHTAGIHLPQMLYIWPYFTFFSWPIILLPRTLSLLTNLCSKPQETLKSLLQSTPRLSVSVFIISATLATVHFNTIVHPFTLADNRHYVFYIFRILLRHPAIKYLVTPLYFFCGWAVLTTLGWSAYYLPTSHQPAHPSPRSADVKPSRKVPKGDDVKATTTGTEGYTNPHPASDVRVSFVLIWLISTSLSLITAPLVEPRYFIIPWVMWRLHVPCASLTTDGVSVSASDSSSSSPSAGIAISAAKFRRYSPLVVEFLWFVLVNGLTGYVFLFKGFEWPQEKGRVQRFMW
ncbi:hypothetical protein AJ80_04669 [Polytolypa hystricis UAMH7299]|uniref:Dol-P-Glc:Glc(2)Man(9)GlcNAc(2)-PP-Dol alpha-1,2-glucosyltransferase n=1 Tax=Polytolypa hystricis (strain UAMH7299) TaxID=1447883 RepID=A0A2B7Y8K9_POLH7|nr:hypothetical protein AJ80_04669 [Polytolypa hystricis UAMH7299]